MNCPGIDESLLREIEVKDAVARRRVVRLLEPLQPSRTRGRCSSACSSSSRAGEDEMVVGDRRLPRVDRVAAGDLVERVNRKRRGAVGGRKQIGVDAAASSPGRSSRAALVDAMRPDDLLRRRHARARAPAAGNSIDRLPSRPRRGTRGVRSRRCRRFGGSRLPSASAAPGRSVLPCVTFDRRRDDGIEFELVAVARIGNRLRTLHHLQTEVERVAAEDVAHVVAADDRPSRGRLLRRPL